MDPGQMLNAIVVDTLAELQDSQLPTVFVTLRDSIHKAAIEATGDSVSLFRTLATGPLGILEMTFTRESFSIFGSMTIAGPGEDQLVIDAAWDKDSDDATRSPIFNIHGNLTTRITGGAAETSVLTLMIRNSNGTSASQTLTLTVNSGGPSTQIYRSVPTTGTVNGGLASAVSVAIEDAYGHVETSNASVLKLTIASGSTSQTLASSSVVSINPVSGVATFGSLKFTKVETYRLKATDGSLTAAVSVKIVSA